MGGVLRRAEGSWRTRAGSARAVGSARSHRGLPLPDAARTLRLRELPRIQRSARAEAAPGLARDDQDHPREPGQPLPRRARGRRARLSHLGEARHGALDQLQRARGRVRRRRSRHGRSARRARARARARPQLRADPRRRAGGAQELDGAARGRGLAGRAPDLRRSRQRAALRALDRAPRRTRAPRAARARAGGAGARHHPGAAPHAGRHGALVVGRPRAHEPFQRSDAGCGRGLSRPEHPLPRRLLRAGGRRGAGRRGAPTSLRLLDVRPLEPLARDPRLHARTGSRSTTTLRSSSPTAR